MLKNSKQYNRKLGKLWWNERFFITLSYVELACNYSEKELVTTYLEKTSKKEEKVCCANAKVHRVDLVLFFASSFTSKELSN